MALGKDNPEKRRTLRSEMAELEAEREDLRLAEKKLEEQIEGMKKRGVRETDLQEHENALKSYDFLKKRYLRIGELVGVMEKDRHNREAERELKRLDLRETTEKLGEFAQSLGKQAELQEFMEKNRVDQRRYYQLIR